MLNRDMTGHTFSFNSDETDFCTLFIDENGDKAAFLKDPVFPPVGTAVRLSNGKGAVVESLSIDLNNPSGYAQIYVSVKLIDDATYAAILSGYQITTPNQDAHIKKIADKSVIDAANRARRMRP